jgi:hypothetical protein
LNEHGTIAALALRHGIPRTTLQSAARRHGITGPSIDPTVKVEPTTGCTYIVRAIGEPLYKIGRTGGDPHHRLQRLRTMSPIPLELVLVLDHLSWEDVLHHHYREKRRHGEWFELDAHDLEHIASWSCSS